MIKSIVRNVAYYSLSLFLLTFFLDGVKVAGGFVSYLIGGIVLALLFIVVKPIINIISFPLRIITLGLFAFVINAILLYLLTLILPFVTVKAFMFSGLSFAGFIIPKFYLNTFLAFMASSLLLSLIVGGLRWLIKE